MEPYSTRRLKIILLVSSLVFLVFLLLAAFEENFTTVWRDHQRDYARLLKNARASNDGPAVEYPIEMRQVYLEDLNRVDRCVACHVGVDNPAMHEAPMPLTAHSGDLLKHHPSDKFGCTICHQGQGRATSKDDAHGHVDHWLEPMLQGQMTYTSCGRCHYEYDLYGGESDLYGKVDPARMIRREELTAGLPGAVSIQRGKQLTVEKGCLGCHQYRGRGGGIGPDITHVGEKTVHDLDFTHVEGQRSVANWLFSHFKSPTAVVPNTLMPDMDLNDQQARDLAAYMVSLKRKSAPAAYTPLPARIASEPVRGETLYNMYCSACHGSDGVGAIVRDAAAAQQIDRPQQLLTPSLRNLDTLGVSSDAYLHEIIATGRPGTSMPAWSAQGLTDDEVDLLVGFIRRWEPRAASHENVASSRGVPRYGAALFRANCAGCHGKDGRGGGVGISLRSQTFLSTASDGFLAQTIINGRPNTAMPSWRQFDNREVSDLLAFLRMWQPVQSRRDIVLAMTSHLAAAASVKDDSESGPTISPASGDGADANNESDSESNRQDKGGAPAESEAATASEESPPNKLEPRPSAKIGLKLFASRCSVCHGANGEGEIGPSLNNQSVLGVVSDAFLHDTIVRGRPGTAMPAWRQMSTEDVADLIAAMRSWQTAPARDLPNTHVTGDWQNGQLLYTGMCASCHGPNAEGAIGPQLANPVLLDTASDATLLQWIGHGRDGTQMRPFLRGRQGAADLSSSQLEDIVTFLRSLRRNRAIGGQQIGLGFAPRGKSLFQQMCSSCHGPKGEGASGPAIRNPGFLAAASDGYLRATIILGREGTEMRSMARRGSGIVELKAEEIDDLVAYLRSDQDRAPISHRFVSGANLLRGGQLFSQFCSSCHGVEGKGNFAPELNNAGFLRAATDGYLQATIIRGRRGTAMRSFGLGGHGLADLEQDEINDIVAFIRQWSPDTRPLRRTEPFPPSSATGAKKPATGAKKNSS